MIDPAITETIEIAMRNGARVAPVAPGLKVPALKAWQREASADPAMHTAWWDGSHHGHGGQTWILWADGTTSGKGGA